MCRFQFNIANVDVGWSVLFSEDRLVKNYSFSESDIKAKQPKGICKDKFPDQPLLSICAVLEAS